MRISILTPTRNRPNNCERFIKSIYNTAWERGGIELLFYVDKDDPAVEAYKDLERHCKTEYIGLYNVRFIIGEPQSVSISWNDLAKECTGDVLIMGNDDLVYRTPGWDQTLEKELVQYEEDKIYVAWFEDKINGENHCAFPMVSKEWYKCLGRFTPGCFNFGYNDTWIFEVGKMLDRCHFIPSVVVEHLHFSQGKSEMDDTYARNRTQEKGNLYARDKVIFNKTRAVRQDDRDKLRRLIDIGRATKLKPQIIDEELKESFTYYDVKILEKEWAPAVHKLKEDPHPWQVEQYKKLCESIDKNGMKYPIIVNASDFRVLRGNQRVWYCIDNNIQMIGAYGIKDDDLDMYIQKTYINKKHYPL
jgi:glycosyltransferase involved in cell wall biosynthesis